MASKLTAGLRTLGVLAALSITGYAVSVLLSDDLGALSAGLFEVGAEPVDPEKQHEAESARMRALARGMTWRTGSVLDDVESDLPAPAVDPSDLRVTEDDARAGFDYVVHKVEKLGRKRRRLEPEEWDDVWRTSNDAFTALSMHLDASNPTEAAELEEAHHRLKQALRRVRVRGGKSAKLQ